MSRYRAVTITVILAAAFLRLVYLAFWSPLDLAADEAHYWDWSRRLDWSYYSKGPLVAFLIRLSCILFGDLSQSLTGTPMLAVRLPAVVCGSLLLWALFRLTAEIFRSERLALGVTLVAVSMPLITAGATLMTIDAPYTCAWAWCWSTRSARLFAADRTTFHWVAAGLCVALGVLAKYTMVLFVPMLGLFLLVTPAVRGQLVRPGFWLMAGIGTLGGVPILIWNIQHDWVTLQHTRGHAGMQGGGPAIHWLGPLNYAGLQFALLLGYWFVIWAAAMWVFRPGRQEQPSIGFLWWMSAPMFLFFALFSLKNGGGEPNWPITAYLSGMVLGAVWLARWLNHPQPAVRRWSWACCLLFIFLGVGLTVVVHDTRLIRPLLARLSGPPSERQPTPLRRFDPTCRLKGWHALAREVDQLRLKLRQQGMEPVLAGSGWVLPGEIAFYLPDQPIVFCVGSGLGERQSQYDMWRPNPVADPGEFRDRTFILVGVSADSVQPFFDSVERVATFEFAEEGHPIARWNLAIGHGFRGLPTRAGNRY